jgi:hypothetical protein
MLVKDSKGYYFMFYKPHDFPEAQLLKKGFSKDTDGALPYIYALIKFSSLPFSFSPSSPYSGQNARFFKKMLKKRPVLIHFLYS